MEMITLTIMIISLIVVFRIDTIHKRRRFLVKRDQ